MKVKQIVAICMGLIKSSEIPRMNLDFDRNNFVTAEIVYGSSKFREITFVFLDLIAIVSEREVTII